jgi:transcriptional regulator GlxA family with amidase domain
MGLSHMPPLLFTPVASAATDAVRHLMSALVAQAPLATRKAALAELFTAVIAGHEATRAPALPAREAREGVRLARALLDAELGREVSLDELAGVARLSRFHLVRAFRDEVGVPPHRYHLLRRIARAQVLLAAGKPPAIVALELGFADQSHFTRYFRKTLRIAPGMYARLGEP